MKGIGIILLLIGFGLGCWGIVFDISVASESSSSSLLSLPDRISNMSLISQREVILAFAVAALASGSAFTACGHLHEQIMEALGKPLPKSEV
jgi:hypothetical protein